MKIFTHELHNDLINTKHKGGLNEVWKIQLLICDIGLRLLFQLIF